MRSKRQIISKTSLCSLSSDIFYNLSKNVAYIPSILIHRWKKFILLIKLQENTGIWLYTWPPTIRLDNRLVDHGRLHDINFDLELVLLSCNKAARKLWLDNYKVFAFNISSICCRMDTSFRILVYQFDSISLRMLSSISLSCIHPWEINLIQDSWEDSSYSITRC